jgi:hypothetical protein
VKSGKIEPFIQVVVDALNACGKTGKVKVIRQKTSWCDVPWNGIKVVELKKFVRSKPVGKVMELKQIRVQKISGCVSVKIGEIGIRSISGAIALKLIKRWVMRVDH